MMRSHDVRRLSPQEYAAIISMIIASLYLQLISFFPLVYNFTTSFEPINFLMNIFYFILGLGILAGVFFLLRKETHLQHIADETFDRVIYNRLEPILRDVAEVQVGLTGVQNQLEMMNINVEKLLKERVTTSPEITSQKNYHIKYIVLINITLAIFLFMLQYPLGYIPYAITILYIIWWAAVTIEFKLWNFEIAWTWIFVPVLVLPVYTLIMNAYLPDYQLFASLFIGLITYVLLYYSWCTYTVKRVLPFDLHDAIKKSIEMAKEQPKKIIKKPMIDFRLTLPSEHQAGMGMIQFAIGLFIIAWFGYAVQHGLIPNISWEFIKLEGFVWSASYTYALTFLGMLLVLSGLKFLKRIKT